MTEDDLERKRQEERAPVEEAGGGEAEGFEQAEEQLERNASHEDTGGNPAADAFTPEVESDRSGAEYGEADEATPRRTGGLSMDQERTDESDQLPEEAPDNAG